MMIFIAQPYQESQMGYLRIRFLNNRFRLFVLEHFYIYIYIYNYGF